MDFRIKKIILWPRDETLSPRIIEFELDKINVITGDSERGKSALISIVDYCLASSKCNVPTGLIRNKTGWFGVHIIRGEQELLLARKEPGDNQASGDMLMIEKNQIKEIPSSIETKSHNVNEVKFRLNQMAQLSNIGFNDNSDSGFKSRPSFRDMVSFIFQPQYIIASPRTLFYRSDTYEHRERLKTIFPYVLGAVDNEVLKAQEEIKELLRKSTLIEREIDDNERLSEKWNSQIKTYYLRAKEYGLLNQFPFPDDDWSTPQYLRHLRTISQNVQRNGLPSLEVGTTNNITSRINRLKNLEIETSQEIEYFRTRQILIKKVSSTNSEFTQATLDQYGRTAGVDWFYKKVNNDTCPFCGSQTDDSKKYIEKLVEVTASLKEKVSSSNDIKKILDKELVEITKTLNSKEDNLNRIRKELNELQRADDQYRTQNQSSSSVLRFIGELEGKINDYDTIFQDNQLGQKLAELRLRIKELRAIIDKDRIRQKLKNAINRIQSSIEFYAKIFQVERSGDPAELDIINLTLKFLGNRREDFLWEIGSGSNYMAYHISTTIALQELFLRNEKHPVPSFIFLDQPSQAYFPELGGNVQEQIEGDDIERVKRIFRALDGAVKRTNNNLQIIVLEHAGSNVWSEFKSVHKVFRWRDEEEDKALIPDEWLD